jgi:hypothetical protein
MSRQSTDNLYIELDYFTPKEYYTYDANYDAFIVPKPSDGQWIFDEQLLEWVRPAVGAAISAE